MGGIVTYEVIYELLRAEKKSEELQKLDADIYVSCVSYLKNKIAIFKADSPSLSEEGRENRKKEINNIRRLIKELMDKRQRKIIELAYVRSHATKMPPLTAYNLLEDESRLLSEAQALFTHYKDSVILPVVNAKSVEPAQQPKVESKVQLVRFGQAVPKFVDENLTIYGPFSKGDIANLPREIADLIVKKGRGEYIRPS